MKRAKTKALGGAIPTAAAAEVANLLEMFSFFLSRRELGKPIDVLAESVRDLRLLLGRLLLDHFMPLPAAKGESFCRALAAVLADRCAMIPKGESADEAYCRSCVGAILACFRYAQELKRRFAGDTVMQKMLALDIPILRPFDYGLQGRLKVLKSQKRRKVHR